MSTAQSPSLLQFKAATALDLITKSPQLWFPENGPDERDEALLSAVPVSFVNYSQGSYLRKMYSIDPDGQTGMIDWTVENDSECRTMLLQAGATSIPDFKLPTAAPYRYASLVGKTRPICLALLKLTSAVNVNIKGTPGSGFDWGFLTTKASNVRIFRGPPQTCTLHPWDAMILRDCTPNTDTLCGVELVRGNRWDILVMKMCEDFDYPWIVVAVKSAGPAPQETEPCCLP